MRYLLPILNLKNYLIHLKIIREQPIQRRSPETPWLCTEQCQHLNESSSFTIGLCRVPLIWTLMQKNFKYLHFLDRQEINLWDLNSIYLLLDKIQKPTEP